MAYSSTFKISSFFLVFLLSTSVFQISSTTTSVHGLAAEKIKMSHVRFYFHELFGETSFVLVSLGLNTSTFGDFRVFDNAVRAGPESTSRLIGRAQGITVDDSLQIHTALTPINFVFTAGKYNGSSLAVYGMSTGALEVNDHPVVGGSGYFRLTRGYGLSKILFYNATYLIIQWDCYVYHI